MTITVRNAGLRSKPKGKRPIKHGEKRSANRSKGESERTMATCITEHGADSEPSTLKSTRSVRSVTKRES